MMQDSLTQSHLEWNQTALEGSPAERYETVAQACANQMVVVYATDSLTYAKFRSCARHWTANCQITWCLQRMFF